MIVLKDEVTVRVRDERALRSALAGLQQANPESLLVASEVVAAAKAKDSPLHSYFVWDDTEAAEKYRLSQARALIRHVTVTMPDDKAEAKLPKYVSLRSDRKRKGGGYRETSRVLGNKEFLAELEETAKKDLDALLRRYEMLKDLCERVRKAAKIPTRRK